MSELSPTSSPSLKPGVKVIPLAFLKVSPNNIRFQDSEPSPEFIESIKTTGVLMPLIVAPQDKDKKYPILVGSQRFKALMKLHPKDADSVGVVCEITTAVDMLDQLAISAIETVHRKNLTPAEYKNAIEVAKRNKITQTALAKAIGVSSSAISQMANSSSWSDYKKRVAAKKGATIEESNIREITCTCGIKWRNVYVEGKGRHWESVNGDEQDE